MGYINFATNEESESEIKRGFETGLINKNRVSRQKVRPRFLYNNRQEFRSVLTSIKEELAYADAFWFSVAFVTKSGLAMLKQEFQNCFDRGAKGRILISSYLNFNTPETLEELLKLQGVEVRIYDGQLHSKGYCFTYDKYKNLIVGSSNLTGNALKENQEWNLHISSLADGEVLRDVEVQFENLWDKAAILTPQWIESYKLNYIGQQRVLKQSVVTPMETVTLVPNSMQQEAMRSLYNLRERGAKRSLLISATGTGKTYLSAFDVRAMNPKRLLFIAHREQLLEQALQSYHRVLGDVKSLGILSGNYRLDDVKGKDYIFATVQMISKEDNLHSFNNDDFDYIIIDEAHRAGAESYRHILEYFSSAFVLGMTATPERSDDKDIYALFDHNIAYEIRLQQALEANLLCPFHYYGISDIIVENEDDMPIKEIEFSQLVTSERIRHIIDMAEYYGYSGSRLRGLVFCSSVEEAEVLSGAFNDRGYRTVALSGKDSQESRNDAVKRLEQEGEEGRLDYIFTRDIFNEGVDIPSVNQVIMLRPTQSAIVFVQQLGRGLRKMERDASNIKEQKEFLIVIDFIGNYSNNYLVPIALSGDRTYNKDNLRRFVAAGENLVPGISTINFSRIAKKRIYKSIDTTSLNDAKLLRSAFDELAKKIGRLPNLVDFQQFGSIDGSKYLEKYASYYHCLKAYLKKKYTVTLTPSQELMLQFISKNLSNGKRDTELRILQGLLDYDTYTADLDKNEHNELLLQNVERVLTNQFSKTKTEQRKNADIVFIKRQDCVFTRTEQFERALNDENFKALVADAVEFGLSQYEAKYANPYGGTDLVIGEKYAYGEICRLLRWDKNVNAQSIGGYLYNEATKTLPVFINYHKSEDIQDTIKYEDRFLNDEYLVAVSKAGRTEKSVDYKRLVDAKKLGITCYLFVRRDKSDANQSKEFYFLGEMIPTGEFEPGLVGGKKMFATHYKLVQPVRSDLYDYITMGSLYHGEKEKK